MINRLFGTGVIAPVTLHASIRREVCPFLLTVDNNGLGRADFLALAAIDTALLVDRPPFKREQ